MKKSIILIMGVLLILISLAWCPWITRDYAKAKVIKTFEESQRGIVDGCGFNCKGCGVKDSHKTLFGYSVKVEYACGMLLSDSFEYHRTTIMIVSFLGTVHWRGP